MSFDEPHGDLFTVALPEAARRIRANNAAKGFGVLPDLENFACSEDLLLEIERQLQDGMDGMAIALIHSEVSEMLEARRRPSWKTDPSEHMPGCIAFVEEGADVIIRVLDLFARLGLEEQLACAIPAKVSFNTKRSHKHGRAF